MVNTAGEYDRFQFNGAFREMLQFVTNDLSAFYFDANKDLLYADAANSERRRGVQLVLLEASAPAADKPMAWPTPQASAPPAWYGQHRRPAARFKSVDMASTAGRWHALNRLIWPAPQAGGTL